MDIEFMTLSTVAQELGWSIAKLRYQLSMHPEIKDMRITQGSHKVRILSGEDVEKLRVLDKGQ
jgi:hypothetical protein